MTEEEKNPMRFFDTNVDNWGPLQWFDRIVDAAEESDRAAGEFWENKKAGKDTLDADITLDMTKNIIASSARHLAKEFKDEVRAALSSGAKTVKPDDHVWVKCPNGHNDVMHAHFDHCACCSECGSVMVGCDAPLSVQVRNLPVQEANTMRSDRKIYADINSAGDTYITVTLSGEGVHDLTEPQIEAALSPKEVPRVQRQGIYIASKVKHADRWRFLRDKVGEPIISTWIDEAGVGESSDLSDLWRRCILEASRADVLIIYREPDEVLKGGWAELGAALASGVQVLAVGIEDFTIANHKGIRHFPDMKLAIAAARELREGKKT